MKSSWRLADRGSSLKFSRSMIALLAVLGLWSLQLSAYADELSPSPSAGSQSQNQDLVPGSVNPDAPIDPPGNDQAKAAEESNSHESARGVHLTFTPQKAPAQSSAQSGDSTATGGPSEPAAASSAVSQGVESAASSGAVAGKPDSDISNRETSNKDIAGRDTSGKNSQAVAERHDRSESHPYTDPTKNPSSAPLELPEGDKRSGQASRPSMVFDDGEGGSAPGDNDKRALAQSPPPAIADTSKARLPKVLGTVDIRKPFKLVAREQLIHNISFRDTPVKEVLAEIARRGNLNVILDKSAVGTVTGEMRDVTLNEAMDSVLAAAGLHTRVLDNNTVFVASQAALVQLGLGRTVARSFKLSYTHPYDIATILQNSIFNKGAIPYLLTAKPIIPGVQPDTSLVRDPTSKLVRGTSRAQVQEGVGFNNAATDPGSQQIRAYHELTTDYQIDQNGGGPIAIPDSKNRQVIVVGSAEDVAVAEEAIHLLDRRPKQIHIQASLVELTNQGIRQLGANLNIQGDGASTSILGNATAPLVQYLPGLGSTFSTNPPSLPFSNNVTNNITTSAFSGLLGSVVPFTAPSIANVNASTAAQSAFNFLTLGKTAGGRANIATAPTALNVSLNLLLQTNKAKIVANPSVVVSDNTETLITIADEVIHKVTSTVSLGVVTTNVELTKAGVFLNVLPKVTEDGFVIMRLRPQVSAPLGPPETFGTTTVTLLSVRDVMSQEVRMKDGQTLVIGGLFQEQEAANLAKVPYLAETPVLGALFRNTLKGRNRTELMLLITPKVVEDDPTTAGTSISDQSASPTM